jgi:hypothetical protein
VQARRASAAALLVLVALTGCSADDDGAAADGSASATVSSSGPATASTTYPGIPGDEALSPPPPDPGAADFAEQLGALPAGPLASTVDLSVSGLVAFAEEASGRCLPTGSDPAVEVDLSDGSVLRLTAGADGLSSVLSAPGVEARHTLTDVQLTPGPPVVVAGQLLTGGTSEPSGSLRMEFTCG